MSSMMTSSAFLPSAASRQRRASASASSSLSTPIVLRVLAMPLRRGANASLRATKPAAGPRRVAARVRLLAGAPRLAPRAAPAAGRLGRLAIELHQRIIDLHSGRRDRNITREQVFDRRLEAGEHALVKRAQRDRLEGRSRLEAARRFERIG